jgi:uncharacterized SAM-binding protein YcdF (DUF218 family)
MKHPRPRWILRRCLATFCVMIVILLTLTAVLFVWPSTNAPRRSDAIVVLGGSGPRLQKGLALARAGYAPYLAVSGGNHTACPSPTHGVQVICFAPHPDTTQGEARATTRLAHAHDWQQIVVVSGTPQTTRARIRFDRCYHGALLFDPVSPGSLDSWVHNVIYEWGALAKALTLQRGC